MTSRFALGANLNSNAEIEADRLEDPALAVEVTPDSGPVVVTENYSIAPEDEQRFLAGPTRIEDHDAGA